MRFNDSARLSRSQTDRYLVCLNLFSNATSCSYVNAVLARRGLPPDLLASSSFISSNSPVQHHNLHTCIAIIHTHLAVIFYLCFLLRLSKIIFHALFKSRKFYMIFLIDQVYKFVSIVVPYGIVWSQRSE